MPRHFFVRHPDWSTVTEEIQNRIAVVGSENCHPGVVMATAVGFVAGWS